MSDIHNDKNLLTAREQEVLDLICKGYTNPEIAKILIISRHTAKAHVTSILKKFEVCNKTLATCYAIKHGLVAFEIDDVQNKS